MFNFKKPSFLLRIGILLLSLVILSSLMASFADIFGIGGSHNDIEVLIEKGFGTSSVADTLKTRGIITFKTPFKLYAKLTGNHVYLAGAHKLNDSMSYGKILSSLESAPDGEGITVTIPEGYELRQIADLLEKEELVNKEIFIREAQTGSFDNDFLTQIPTRENRLEGYLFPDTYVFEKTMSEHDIISLMLDTFEEKVMPVYTSSGTDKSLDDIIKLASVIEREAAGDSDRGKVASVFINRINKEMKLESCATVQYILKERKPVLSNDDTRIDSPYNTYMYQGLPYGPIASPGLLSVNAALYPEDTNYLYFMATADGTASVFAETYEEHLENMKRIQG